MSGMKTVAYLRVSSNTQDTNKILASLAEQNLIQMKDQRDATVQAMNTAIEMQAKMPELYREHMTGTTQAIHRLNQSFAVKRPAKPAVKEAAAR